MSKNGYILAGLITILCMRPAAFQAQALDKTFTVVIDAGHGGKDPGAKGSVVYEKAINLAVALKLGGMITANHQDVKVIYTRKDDRFIELYERANIANRHKADLFISIHTNSLKKGKANSQIKGTETYTLGLAKSQENLEVAMTENSVILLEDNYLQRYEGFNPNSSESYIIFEFIQNKHMEQSVWLASEIQKSFGKAKRENRGVRQAGFIVLKATGMPSVLVELGFISNKEEEKYMNSQAGQNQLARSIYQAFVAYKNDYSRKQGGLTRSNNANASKKETSELTAERPTSTSVSEKSKNDDEIVYKVQILSSDKKIAANSPLLKGYKASYYQEGNLYKYTVGETTDKTAIHKLYKELSSKFKDAFIIRMKNGQRIK